MLLFIGYGQLVDKFNKPVSFDGGRASLLMWLILNQPNILQHDFIRIREQVHRGFKKRPNQKTLIINFLPVSKASFSRFFSTSTRAQNRVTITMMMLTKF